MISRIRTPLMCVLVLAGFGFVPRVAYAQAQDISNGEPYQHTVDVIFANNDPSMNVPATDVPVGKRLVVRDVSGVIYGPKGEKYKVIFLSSVTGSSQDAMWHTIAITGESFDDPEANANATIFSVPSYWNARRDEQHRAYRVSIVRSAANLNHPTFVKMTVSGYLVDDPIDPIIIFPPRGQ